MTHRFRHIWRLAGALLPLASALVAPNVLAQRNRPAPAAPAAAAPAVDPASYSALRFRHIGPVGNRTVSVAGVSGDPLTYYAGAASGGIWKTNDGGVHWQPIFDDQPVSSIGSLAVAPSDPNVVWAGTGESFIRSHISVGWGIFKSTDAGRTWARMGLENTGRIGRVVIHPTNPDIVYAAAQGHSYGPSQDRGLYRTMDGGKTWERVLFSGDSAGVIDVQMDPNNPRIIFAATWQLEIHTWGRTSGGSQSGIYMSRDGGTTWKRLTGNGLPTRPFGKVSLAIPKVNSNRIYALIETGDGVPMNGQPTDNGKLWRSDDGGTNWQLVSYDRQLGGRSAYYNRMIVSPDDQDEAYFLAASYAKTLDGGRSTVDLPNRQQPGGDHHDMWIDPTNGNRQIVAHDQGVSITQTRGREWLRIQLPIAQMYHAEVDNAIPYHVLGNRQDGPSTRGPSNSLTTGFGGSGIPRGDWRSVGGGESGWATPDPKDPNLVWSSASGSGSRGGIVTRYNVLTGITRDVEVWPQSTGGHPASEVKYRFVWTFPLTISPHDNTKVYVGSQHVHQTTDAGRSWQVISPDLTRNDKSRQGFSGGLTGDNIGVEYYSVLYAIEESPLEKGLLWTGSNDGLVHLTRDAGKTWTNVTGNIPGILETGTIANIDASGYDAGTAYLTVDGHQVNNFDPWVYKTTDYGKTWKLIVNGIAKTPLSYAHCVREDPVRRGLLYLGTENGLYVSFDDGDHWQAFQNNLPHAPVYWITVQQHFNDLVLATYGRGFWIMDDLSPLQQLAAEPNASIKLFTPRATYRFRNVQSPMTMPDDPTIGENPTYGASVNYWLKTGASGDVSLTIQNAQGQAVRTLTGTRQAGLNRVWWDLRGEQSKIARMRTPPLFGPPDWRMGTAGWYQSVDVGRVAPLMPPGRYSVKLTVGGQEFTQPLEVRKDPNSGASDQEIATQTEMLTGVRNDLDATVDMINEIETVRAQLVALRTALSNDARAADVRASADSLEQKFIAVEENLAQLRVTGRGQDQTRWPTKLGGQLNYLYQSVSSSDYAPTTQSGEVGALLDAQVKTTRQALDKLLATDLEAFRNMVRQRNLRVIM